MTERRPSLRVVAALASAGLLVALALVLSQSGHHRTGTNGAPAIRRLTLSPHAIACQSLELVPRRTARVAFVPEPGQQRIGPFAITIYGTNSALLGSGRVAPGVYGGSERAVARIPEVRSNQPGATVCITNDGARPARILGDPTTNPAQSARVGGTTAPPHRPLRQLRFDYELGDSTTWWSFAPTIARRYGLVKATFFGAWTFWATLAALLVLALGTIWYAARAIEG